jgi:RNA polymerase sigma-70 factor (ECF subfamily)
MRVGAATVRWFGLGSRADSPLAELVGAARRGDRGAFAELHRRYCRMVHAILLARVPRAAADDLVQDVFVAALEHLGALREPDAFGGWLAQVARRRAADHLRAQHGRSEDALSDELPAPGAGDGAPAAAEAARVLAVLRGLPDAYRETLVMRLVEGMTGPEIAERTGLQPASVRVNLHRGMRLLRERLGLPVGSDDDTEQNDA